MNDPGDEHAEPAIARPTPLERAATWARMISGFGNGLAALFGGPLYMVGSALTIADPGDVDLRLMLPREVCVLYWGEDFDRSWDGNACWVARKREELKQSRRLTKTFRRHARRFDFQFQCTLFSDIDGEPIGHDGKPRSGEEPAWPVARARAHGARAHGQRRMPGRSTAPSGRLYPKRWALA